MPSFVCDFCQETLKKAKLDQHAQRCRQAAFSCIDCYKTFKGVEYRAHSSCITEVQKHHTIKNKDGQQVQGMKTVSAGNGSSSSKIVPEPKKKNEVPEKRAAPMEANEKTGKSPRELVISKLSKEPLSLKELFKVIKKGKEDKKERKAAKKWLKEALTLAVDASGKNFVLNLPKD